MPVSRRDVLECLATVSDAEAYDTTTVGTLGSLLDADERTLQAHLEQLADCELARRLDDGRVRITITGEELLELEPNTLIIVDPPTDG
ncbi:MAG: hypothetical protein V5A49_00035 [Haloarcula sp.]|jgi:hypothetical protein